MIFDTPFAFANSDGNPRAISVGTTPVGGAANNSVESCTAACFAAGYPIAGVEYSDECCTSAYSPMSFPLIRLFSRLRYFDRKHWHPRCSKYL